MRTFLIAANGFAVFFSLVWLVGHSTVRMGDWEFWFASGYLLLAGMNSLYLMRADARR